jgi:predicted dehydrogenase
MTTVAAGGGLRMAVIGAGHFGRHHARILSASPGVRLEAVVDVDPRAAARVASEAGVRAETDAATLAGRVDAVTVAVPTDRHHAVAVPSIASTATTARSFTAMVWPMSRAATASAMR